MMDISDKNQKPELIHSKAKRDQFAYEIRKSKNDEFVRAKRMKYFDNIRGEPDQNNEEIMAEAEGVKKSYDELTSNFYSAIEKGDPDLITTTVTHIRHKISAKSTPNLKEFYATGLLNSILKILDEKFSNYILLQKEALWVAINAFSGEFELYKEIVDENLINLIYSFIWHKEPFMVEEAFHCLGNLSGDYQNEGVRKLLIECNIIDVILKYCRTTTEIPDDVLRLCSWTVSNLALLKSRHEKFYPIMGIIEQFIFQKDVEICSNGLWTLSNLLNSTDDVIEKIASDYIMKRVLNLLDHPDMMVKAPALRCIGNISSGKSEFTKKLWSFGAIKKLEPLLDNKKPGIRREACWTISNFLAEDANIVASVFDTQILQKLIGKVFSDVDDVKVECAICLANAMQISTWDQAESIINMGILKPVAHMLGSINTKVIEYGLCVLEHILMKGEILKEEHGLEYNYCFIHLEEEGILKHLENLQMINDDRLYKKVAAIIDRYLPYE